MSPASSLNLGCGFERVSGSCPGRETVLFDHVYEIYGGVMMGLVVVIRMMTQYDWVRLLQALSVLERPRLKKNCVNLVKIIVISAPLTICGYPNFPDKFVHIQGKYPIFTKIVVDGSMDSI